MINRPKSLTAISLFFSTLISALCFSLIIIPSELRAQTQEKEALFFESEQDTLSRQNIEVLNRTINFVKDTPEFTITVEGYSDITGRADYNMNLSEKRARLVRNYLIDLGIDPDKIKVSAKGGTEKFGKGETNEALQQNRRVNLIVDIAAEPEVVVETSEIKVQDQSPDYQDSKELAVELPPTEPQDIEDDKTNTVSSADLSKTLEKKVREHASDKISFSTPLEMQVGETYLVETEISDTFLKALSGDLDDLKLDNRIGMRLSGYGFKVVPDSSGDQNNGPDYDSGIVEQRYDGSPLSWKWYVSPERDGIRSLVLSIALTVKSTDGVETDGEYDAIVRVITAKPSIIHAVAGSYWIMGILIVLIVAAVAWILIRRVRID